MYYFIKTLLFMLLFDAICLAVMAQFMPYLVAMPSFLFMFIGSTVVWAVWDTISHFKQERELKQMYDKTWETLNHRHQR